MKLSTLFLAASTLAGAAFASANDATTSAFEKDREAILKMAGDFKVSFHFQETLSLNEGYTTTEKPYDEEAFETVKVVEDTGKQIALQHVLQVDGQVVKHWCQIWTYEDTKVLEFQGDRDWAFRTLPEAEVKGGWTQRVTEVTDEPRYEGWGKWVHNGGVSEWTSTISHRPLPRREYTKRDDYDLLIVTNRHTVTHEGWYHEQDNVKQVKRDGKTYPLCREVGFNTYKRLADHDFAAANKYWDESAAFWKQIRDAWDTAVNDHAKITLRTQVGGKQLRQVASELMAKTKDGGAVSQDEVDAAIKSFVVASDS